jgi:S1-C subfamily serine protease
MFGAEKDRRLRVFAALAILALLSGQSCRRRGHEEVSLPPARETERAGAVLSYADVVDSVAPAVVTIRSQRVTRAPRQFPFFDDPLFREFFGDRYGAQ